MQTAALDMLDTLIEAACNRNNNNTGLRIVSTVRRQNVGIVIIGADGVHGICPGVLGQGPCAALALADCSSWQRARQLL